MDIVKARDLEKILRSKPIDGWVVEDYVKHGKSAAVFRANRAGKIAALKVFDKELIERYGDHVQIARIERELTLVGHHHPNMVPILDGGFDEPTGNHFIVMEFVNGPNLADCLDKIPERNLPALIEQLASAAQFLENMQLCHRDIKPENIALTEDCSRAVLLDFGVLRPIGATGLTDGEHLRAFVGTLQYSSPEFLLRREEDSAEGWRALTLYQLGGVLHDLIMRKPLFSEFLDPYAVLVNAVQTEQPKIQSSSAPSYLVDLASKCLLKDWRVRNKLVQWQDFAVPIDDAIGSAKQRVANRSALIQAQRAQIMGALPATPKSNEVLTQAIEHLKISIRTIRNENTIFPPANVSRGNPNELRVRFDHATDVGLQQPLAISLHVDVLEAQSGAIEVKGRAYFGRRDSKDDKQEAVTIYAGLCTSASIREALENFLYEIFDIAQQLTATDERWVAGSMPEES